MVELDKFVGPSGPSWIYEPLARVAPRTISNLGSTGKSRWNRSVLSSFSRENGELGRERRYTKKKREEARWEEERL